MIALTNDVAISSGSACTTAAVEPSHVLKAIGMSDEAVHSSVRIGLGRMTTEAEVEYAGACLVREGERLRKLAVDFDYSDKESVGPGSTRQRERPSEGG